MAVCLITHMTVLIVYLLATTTIPYLCLGKTLSSLLFISFPKLFPQSHGLESLASKCLLFIP